MSAQKIRLSRIVDCAFAQLSVDRGPASEFSKISIIQTVAMVASHVSLPSSPGAFIDSRNMSSNLMVQLSYVYEIVDYLTRYKQFPDNRGRFTIEDAKDFSWAKHGKILKPRTVAKFWEENKLASPYIYSLLRNQSFRAGPDTNPAQVAKWLRVYFSKSCRVQNFLGTAAYAADVLDQLVQIRIEDFQHLQRRVPVIRPFSTLEQRLVRIPTRYEAIE